MKEFAEQTLKMDYYLVEQGVSRDNNSYATGHRRPISSPFSLPIFDFSEEALRQSKLRGFYYLTYASYFGIYFSLVL